MAPNGEMMSFSARQKILLQMLLYFSVDVKHSLVLSWSVFSTLLLFVGATPCVARAMPCIARTILCLQPFRKRQNRQHGHSIGNFTIRNHLDGCFEWHTLTD